jgi:hypothetical protein
MILCASNSSYVSFNRTDETFEGEPESKAPKRCSNCSLLPSK